MAYRHGGRKVVETSARPAAAFLDIGRSASQKTDKVKLVPLSKGRSSGRLFSLADLSINPPETKVARTTLQSKTGSSRFRGSDARSHRLHLSAHNSYAPARRRVTSAALNFSVGHKASPMRSMRSAWAGVNRTTTGCRPTVIATSA